MSIHPDWLAWSLAAVMVAAAAFHAGQLVVAHRRAGPPDRDVHLTHATMGVAMAVMLVGSPARLATVVGACVFSVVTLWFGGRAVRASRVDRWSAGRHVQQVVMAGGMVYMLALTMPPDRAGAAMAPMAAMRGMPMSGLPAAGPAAGGSGGSLGLSALGIALAVGLLAVSVAKAGTLTSRWAPGTLSRVPAGVALTVPRTRVLATCCQLAMSVGGAFMVLAMLQP